MAMDSFDSQQALWASRGSGFDWRQWLWMLKTVSPSRNEVSEKMEPSSMVSTQTAQVVVVVVFVFVLFVVLCPRAPGGAFRTIWKVNPAGSERQLLGTEMVTGRYLAIRKSVSWQNPFDEFKSESEFESSDEFESEFESESESSSPPKEENEGLLLLLLL